MEEKKLSAAAATKTTWEQIQTWSEKILFYKNGDSN